MPSRGHLNLKTSRFFGGFRALATDGVALPVLNTFRMLNKMGTKRLPMTSTGDLGLEAMAAGAGEPDVSALASRDETPRHHYFLELS